MKVERLIQHNEQGGVRNSTTLNSISEQIIKNAWRLSNYDYFPNEPKENDTMNNDEETETEVEMLDFSETPK